MRTLAVRTESPEHDALRESVKAEVMKDINSSLTCIKEMSLSNHHLVLAVMDAITDIKKRQDEMTVPSVIRDAEEREGPPGDEEAYSDETNDSIGNLLRALEGMRHTIRDDPSLILRLSPPPSEEADEYRVRGNKSVEQPRMEYDLATNILKSAQNDHGIPRSISRTSSYRESSNHGKFPEGDRVATPRTMALLDEVTHNERSYPSSVRKSPSFRSDRVQGVEKSSSFGPKITSARSYSENYTTDVFDESNTGIARTYSTEKKSNKSTKPIPQKKRSNANNIKHKKRLSKRATWKKFSVASWFGSFFNKSSSMSRSSRSSHTDSNIGYQDSREDALEDTPVNQHGFLYNISEEDESIGTAEKSRQVEPADYFQASIHPLIQVFSDLAEECKNIRDNLTTRFSVTDGESIKLSSASFASASFRSPTSAYTSPFADPQKRQDALKNGADGLDAGQHMTTPSSLERQSSLKFERQSSKLSERPPRSPAYNAEESNLSPRQRAYSCDRQSSGVPVLEPQKSLLHNQHEVNELERRGSELQKTKSYTRQLSRVSFKGADDHVDSQFPSNFSFQDMMSLTTSEMKFIYPALHDNPDLAPVAPSFKMTPSEFEFVQSAPSNISALAEDVKSDTDDRPAKSATDNHATNTEQGSVSGNTKNSEENLIVERDLSPKDIKNVASIVQVMSELMTEAKHYMQGTSGDEKTKEEKEGRGKAQLSRLNIEQPSDHDTSQENNEGAAGSSTQERKEYKDGCAQTKHCRLPNSPQNPCPTLKSPTNSICSPKTLTSPSNKSTKSPKGVRSPKSVKSWKEEKKQRNQGPMTYFLDLVSCSCLDSQYLTTLQEKNQCK
jgi:hypothetical protein